MACGSAFAMDPWLKELRSRRYRKSSSSPMRGATDRWPLERSLSLVTSRITGEMLAAPLSDWPGSMLRSLLWAGVGCGHPGSPLQKLFCAIVSVDRAFNQRRTCRVIKRRLDGSSKFSSIGGEQAKARSIRGIEHLHQAGIVPVLDVVVWSIVDLNLDRVPAVVDQEDEDRQLQPDHLTDLLCRELERSVAYHEDNASAPRLHRVPEGGWNGPTDVSPLHLDLELGALRQIHIEPVEP